MHTHDIHSHDEQTTATTVTTATTATTGTTGTSATTTPTGATPATELDTYRSKLTSRRRFWARAIALLAVLALLAAPLGAMPGIAAEPSKVTKAFQAIKQVYDLIQQAYVDDVPLGDLADAAIYGMTQQLDPYSEYLTPADLEEFTQGIDHQYSGIGVQVQMQDRGITITRVFPDSPAAAAGLQVGDVLLAADGKSLEGLTLDEAVTHVRGPQGSDVRLKIGRGDETFEVTVKRAQVAQPTVEYEIVSDDIGLIHLTTFGQATPREVAAALESLNAQGVRALVLDLRNNPGGYLDAALVIAELFLPAGKDIIHMNYKDGTRQTYTSAGPGQSLPVAVLVNGGTASASEILAGALQDHDLAFLVGEPTYGKGRVQSLYNLENGAYLKMTNALYTTPSGRHIDRVGLTPDFVEPNGVRRNGSPIATDRTLAVGTQGDDVYRLQERLIELGHDPGPVDGIYGQQTAAAVRAFQAASGLPVTGSVDADTLAALNLGTEFRDRQLLRAVELLESGLQMLGATDASRNAEVQPTP